MDNVQKEFGPTMFLIRCAGISASSRYWYFNVFLKVYSLGWFVSVTACMVITFLHCRQLRENELWTGYELFRYRTTMSVMYVNYLILAVATMARSSSFRWVVQRLHRIDKNLMKHGMHTQFKAGFHVYMRILACAGVGIVWASRISDDISPLKMADWYFTTATTLSSCASQCLFYSLMKMVADRIDFASKKLEETFVHMPYEGGACKVTALIEAHNDILQVAAHLEDTCSFQLLVTSTTSFMLLVSRVYYICSDSDAAHSSNFYTCLNRFLELYTLVVATMNVLRKEEDYEHNLYENLIDDKNKFIITNDRVKIFRLYNRKLQFTASGFFKVDYALLASVCGAVFTFVIILLQLD